MNKQFFTFIASVALLFHFSSCNKKDNNKARVSVYGGSVAVGTAMISPECGTMATISIYPQNTYNYGTNYNNGAYTISATNGGTFEFQLAPGNYIIQGQSNTGYTASNCQYSNIVYSTANNNVTANVCIGTSVQAHCPPQQYMNGTGYGTAYGNPYGTTGYVDPYQMQGPNCMWNVYGCSGYMYPGTGTVGVGKPNLYFYTNKTTQLELDLEFKNGSNVNAAAPGLGENGWKIEVQPNGKIKSLKDNTEWNYLFYEAQVHHTDLQMQQSIKVKRDEAVNTMMEIMRNEGFNEATIKDFEAHNKNKMPPNEDLNIYPQSNSQIDPIVKYKTKASLVQKKVWFIIIPELSTAQLKNKKPPQFFASYFDTKNRKNYVQAKKTDTKRQVANSDEIVVEEWGVGYLLEK